MTGAMLWCTPTPMRCRDLLVESDIFSIDGM
jgi:hypothetical protein